eukprot:gene12306-15468_t
MEEAAFIRPSHLKGDCDWEASLQELLRLQSGTEFPRAFKSKILVPRQCLLSAPPPLFLPKLRTWLRKGRMDRKKKVTKAEERERQEDLINYYKRRIDEFELERSSLLQSVEKCSVQAAELHRLDWENRKRADEVRELQKALSDAHAYLFEERQRLLTSQAENDELRLQEIEDRKRIQQLLNYDGGRGGKTMLPHYMEQPGVDTLMLKIESMQAQLNEQWPGVDTFMLKIESMQAQLNEQPGVDTLMLKIESMQAQLNEQQPGVGTLMLKIESMQAQLNEQPGVGTLMLKIESMQAQLNEQKQLAGERVASLLKDWRIPRRERQGLEERTLSTEAVLASERASFAGELAELRRRGADEAKQMKQQSESRMEDSKEREHELVNLASVHTATKAQLESRREHELVNLASVHTATKAQLERRVGELESKSSKLLEANKQLEMRRHMDMEGCTADITTLRKSIAAVNRKLHEMRLIERLGDDDRLDTIIEQLRKKAPSMVPTPNDQSETSSIVMGKPGRGSSDTTPSVKGDVAKSITMIKNKLRVVEDGGAAVMNRGSGASLFDLDKAGRGGSDTTPSVKEDVAKSISLIKNKLRVVEDGLNARQKSLHK